MHSRDHGHNDEQGTIRSVHELDDSPGKIEREDQKLALFAEQMHAWAK